MLGMHPLESFEVATAHVSGCLWVSICSMLICAVLWLAARGVNKARTRPSTRGNQYPGRTELRHQFESLVLIDCLKLLYASSALFSIFYLGRALLLKWVVSW